MNGDDFLERANQFFEEASAKISQLREQPKSQDYIDMDWLLMNGRALACEYGGRWVVVHDRQVRYSSGSYLDVFRWTEENRKPGVYYVVDFIEPETGIDVQYVA